MRKEFLPNSKVSMLWSDLNKVDYHVHPDYSLDATGTIDEYCDRALELGLKQICFTTHYDSDPFREKIDPFMRRQGKVIPALGTNIEILLQGPHVHRRFTIRAFREYSVWDILFFHID